MSLSNNCNNKNKNATLYPPLVKWTGNVPVTLCEGARLCWHVLPCWFSSKNWCCRGHTDADTIRGSVASTHGPYLHQLRINIYISPFPQARDQWRPVSHHGLPSHLLLMMQFDLYQDEGLIDRADFKWRRCWGGAVTRYPTSIPYAVTLL